MREVETRNPCVDSGRSALEKILGERERERQEKRENRVISEGHIRKQRRVGSTTSTPLGEAQQVLMVLLLPSELPTGETGRNTPEHRDR